MNNNYNNIVVNTETITIINGIEKKSNSIINNNIINDNLIINNVILKKQLTKHFTDKLSSFQIFNQTLLKYYNKIRSTHLFTYDVQINSLSSIINRIAGFYLYLFPLYFYMFINIIPIEYFFLLSSLIRDFFLLIIIASFQLCVYMLFYHILRIIAEKNLDKLLSSINYMQHTLTAIFYYSLVISIIITILFCFVIF